VNDRAKYLNEVEYWRNEKASYWPVSSELMAKYLDGTQTHRRADDTLLWCKNGLHHRDGDRPAWINTHDDLIWWQNGERHRDGDKPAFIGADSSLRWYQNGWLHRDGDRPAVIYADGSLAWWKNGLRHRTSGPAVIKSDGDLEWQINGTDITREVREWLAWTKWQGTPEQTAEFKLRFA
jgi:hypothetical protein